MAMFTSFWIPLLTAVGIGGIGAALISRWATISTLRQNWVDELRNDLATCFTEIGAMRFETLATDELPDQKAAMLAYRRILLRLNIEEPLHVELAKKLDELLMLGGSAATDREINEAVLLSRQILKQEWNVVKYGAFTKPIAALKDKAKAMEDKIREMN